MQVITNGLEEGVQDMDRAERKTGFRPYLPSPGVLYTDPGHDAGVVGRKLQINGLSALVVGILPGSFQFPSEAEAWAPLSFTMTILSPSRRGGHGLEVLAIVEVSGEVDESERLSGDRGNFNYGKQAMREGEGAGLSRRSQARNFRFLSSQPSGIRPGCMDVACASHFGWLSRPVLRIRDHLVHCVVFYE